MRRLRIWAGLFAACLAALPCWAQARQPAKPDEPPQLIVAISIDQFSADLFGEYRASFVHGFKRLTEGVVFPRAYQSHAGTETCPGHSTILTGARPGRTGIIANNWIDQSAPRVDKTVYCLEDPHIPGSSSTRYTVSSRHLRVPTLGDRMKAADSGARVVSVAGKDRAALLLGGRSTDAIWWIGPEGFTTLPDRSPTPEVDRANVRFRAALASPRAMMPMLRHCEARDLAIDLGRGKQVGRGRFQRIAGDLPALRASPDADGMVIDLAIALAKALALGRRGHTDLLSVGLSATDHIGHSFGNGGVESCLQVAALDRALGVLFERLDATGVDYVVMLTADHGAHDIPERHRQKAMPREQRVDPALYPEALSSMLSAKTGLSGPLLFGPDPQGDLYLSRTLSPQDRGRVMALVLEQLRAHPQVHRVLTRDEIAASTIPAGPPDEWTLEQRARAGFDPERSGDLFVILQPWITAEKDTQKPAVAVHGRPFDNDRRVPLLFWRKGLRGFEQPLAVETVDIAPTLSALIGLHIAPGEVDGRCLDLLAGAADSCPAATGVPARATAQEDSFRARAPSPRFIPLPKK